MQLLLGRVFIPFVKAFFAVGIANYTMEEQRFSGMVEFVENIILTSLKLLTAFVFGLNIIKNAIVPLQDSIIRTTVRRSLSYIPGVGQTLSAASDLFFASGELIRNGVGIAALILLILISMKPMLQIGCYTLGYQLFLALVEPVSDKRMAGVIQVVAKGGSLLFKILTSCVVMIFITVAMTSLLTQRSW